MTRHLLESPEGRKWMPQVRRYLKDGGNPPERTAALAVNLVSGRADALTGRYFHAMDDFDAVVARTDAILAQNLYALRMRR
jgi:hypothetical protein